MILDTFDLDGAAALVTGSSAGLGAAIAVALAEAGADVAVHGNTRSPEETRAAVEGAGRRAAAFTANLADRASADRLIEATFSRFGRIDILVNNAGTIHRAPAVDYTDADWDRVVEVNLTSAFRMSRAAAREMIATGRGGKIINVGSILSFQGGITVPAYAATKGALVQLTKALANEWASKGINVNAIAPGYIDTDFTAALRGDPARHDQILERIPARRWGRPSDVTGAAVFLASRAAEYVHGHVLVVDGGWLGR